MDIFLPELKENVSLSQNYKYDKLVCSHFEILQAVQCFCKKFSQFWCQNFQVKCFQNHLQCMPNDKFGYLVMILYCLTLMYFIRFIVVFQEYWKVVLIVNTCLYTSSVQCEISFFFLRLSYKYGLRYANHTVIEIF